MCRVLFLQLTIFKTFPGVRLIPASLEPSATTFVTVSSAARVLLGSPVTEWNALGLSCPLRLAAAALATPRSVAIPVSPTHATKESNASLFGNTDTHFQIFRVGSVRMVSLEKCFLTRGNV